MRMVGRSGLRRQPQGQAPNSAARAHLQTEHRRHGDAPTLEIVPALTAAGASVRTYDAEGMEEATKLLAGIAWAESAYDTWRAPMPW